MITLEALQVFPIEDGASGLVLATWAERSSVQGVPIRQHSILISSEEAQLLAQELNRVTEQVEGGDGVIYRYRKDIGECAPGGVKSSAGMADLHMHGLTYYRGAHCVGLPSQHQQVAVKDMPRQRSTDDADYCTRCNAWHNNNCPVS